MPQTPKSVRDTLGTGIYFMVYESGKQVVTTMAGDNPNSNKLAVVAAGGMCGLVSWAMICMFPPFFSIYIPCLVKKAQLTMFFLSFFLIPPLQILSTPLRAYINETRFFIPAEKQ